MGKGEGWGEGNGQGYGAAEWSNGLFGCFNDCSNCLCGYYCWCCLNYKNAERLGNSGCIHTLLAFLYPAIPAYLQVCKKAYHTIMINKTKLKL